jgi:hypothetical protein
MQPKLHAFLLCLRLVELNFSYLSRANLLKSRHCRSMVK